MQSLPSPLSPQPRRQSNSNANREWERPETSPIILFLFAEQQAIFLPNQLILCGKGILIANDAVITAGRSFFLIGIPPALLTGESSQVHHGNGIVFLAESVGTALDDMQLGIGIGFLCSSGIVRIDNLILGTMDD